MDMNKENLNPQDHPENEGLSQNTGTPEPVLDIEAETKIETEPQVEPNAIVEAEANAETEIKAAEYQRISQYTVNDSEIFCKVVKLGDEIAQPKKYIPFINDEKVIGKWEVKGVYAVKEDYLQNIFCDNTGFYGGDVKYLYFLPLIYLNIKIMVKLLI